MIIINSQKVLFGLFLIIFFLFGILLLYLPLNESRAEIEFIIKNNDGASKIGQSLEDAGIIFNKNIFIIYTLITGRDKQLKAGKYILSSSMSISEIANLFSKGLAKSEDIEITIPEGFNKWEIGEKLQEAKLVKIEDFLSIAGSYEGYLFPDTYRFNKNSTAIEIAEKMKNNFEKKVNLVKLTPTRDQIILASILEKEVKTKDDMELVSGILWKRLDVGMPLQVDAAVAYGKCLESEGKFCDIAIVSIRDSLKIDGPYNTYALIGLPVGPISNPGIAAIKASLNPVSSDYWYYLSATAEDSRTIFSKTSAEHARNRAKYLK